MAVLTPTFTAAPAMLSRPPGRVTLTVAAMVPSTPAGVTVSVADPPVTATKPPRLKATPASASEVVVPLVVKVTEVAARVTPRTVRLALLAVTVVLLAPIVALKVPPAVTPGRLSEIVPLTDPVTSPTVGMLRVAVPLLSWTTPPPTDSAALLTVTVTRSVAVVKAKLPESCWPATSRLAPVAVTARPSAVE